MKQSAHKLALFGLQYALGLVLLYESSRLVFSATAARELGKAHLPHMVVALIAGLELLGAVLFLIPPAVLVGARMLLISFLLAAIVHILHGQPNIGFLVVSAMAVLTVMTGRGKGVTA